MAEQIAQPFGDAFEVATGNGSGTLTATTAYTYDSVGNPTIVNGPLSGTNDQGYFFYDDLRRQIGAIGPDPDGAGALKRRAAKSTFTTRGGVDTSLLGTATGTALSDLNALTVLQTTDTDYDSYGRPDEVRFKNGPTITVRGSMATGPNTGANMRMTEYNF